MRIDQFKTRTTSNPTVGVTFSAADRDKITELGTKLIELPHVTLNVIRESLAREILFLDGLADWTSGEAEQDRVSRLETALLAYQATYDAAAYARVKQA